MIRKLMALLLVLLMVPACVLAQETEYVAYQDPDGRFAFGYPSTWTVLDKNNVDALMDIAAQQGDETMAALVESVRPQISQLNMVVLVSENMASNVNVICQDVGMALTADMLLLMEGQLKEQLSAGLPGLTFNGDAQKIDVEGVQGMLMEYSYTISGMEMSAAQAYVPMGNSLYTFTLTLTEASVEQDVVEFGVMIGSLQEL